MFLLLTNFREKFILLIRRGVYAVEGGHMNMKFLLSLQVRFGMKVGMRGG